MHAVIYTFSKKRMSYPISREEREILPYEFFDFLNEKLISITMLNSNKCIIKVWEW